MELYFTIMHVVAYQGKSCGLVKYVVKVSSFIAEETLAEFPSLPRILNLLPFPIGDTVVSQCYTLKVHGLVTYRVLGWQSFLLSYVHIRSALPFLGDCITMGMFSPLSR